MKKPTVSPAIRVSYLDDPPIELQLNLRAYHHQTLSGGGVYILTENGRYYIGQTTDAPARFASHWRVPVSCKMMAPRCAVLGLVRTQALSWHQRERLRLNAEARFIAAALSMELPLTNTLSAYKRDKLLARFSDVSCERARIAQALLLLEAR